MSIASKHPQYSDYLQDWTQCRDSYRGERRVKAKGAAYLPPTGAMTANNVSVVNSKGWHAYQAYKSRAVFPQHFSDAVETFIGLLWTKPPSIELPAQLEDMLENATIHGEGLNSLLRRIHEQQLVAGRLGLLLDLPLKPDPERPLPYIALYNAEAIINWDDGSREDVTRDSLNMVVLDESEDERQADFNWQRKEKYRLLILGDLARNEGDGEKATYSVGVLSPSQSGADISNPDIMKEPSIRGNTLEQIPFVFINSKDIVATPDDPPLMGLSNLCMTIYRGEADYRQSLFMQGQDTLVVIGGDEDKSYQLGAGASIVLKAVPGAEAKFIGVDSNGLTEMREALQNDRAEAAQKAGNLIDLRSRQKESGDALKTRLGAQTATLTQIAIAAAYGLEQILRIAAEWVGANPDDVKVEPNLEFEDAEMTGKDLVDLMSAKSMGAPLAQETIHDIMVSKGMTEKTYEEELAECQEEEALVMGGPGTITNPDDPNYDPNKDPNYDPTKDPNSSQYADPNDAHQKQLELTAAKGGGKPPPPGKKAPPPAKK